MKVLKFQYGYFIFFRYTNHIEIIECNKLLIELSEHRYNILREKI